MHLNRLTFKNLKIRIKLLAKKQAKRWRWLFVKRKTTSDAIVWGATGTAWKTSESRSAGAKIKIKMKKKIKNFQIHCQVWRIFKIFRETSLKKKNKKHVIKITSRARNAIYLNKSAMIWFWPPPVEVPLNVRDPTRRADWPEQRQQKQDAKNNEKRANRWTRRNLWWLWCPFFFFAFFFLCVLMRRRRWRQQSHDMKGGVTVIFFFMFKEVSI